MGAVALTVVTAACGLFAQSPPATNVILFIGDGMGFAQIQAGRDFEGHPLVFESWSHGGRAVTCNVYSQVTDSAAAGTAIATGHKVANGVVSVALPGDGSAYETVLEYMRRTGKKSGLVTTSYLTDATPAVFAAHNSSRGNTAAIAADYLQHTRPNVLFGGGGSGLSVSSAIAAGYSVATNRAGMLALDPEADAWASGQFGEGSMPYEFDGLGVLPHLSEMTASALRMLENGTNGFFLMVEGGLIDHACHANDIVRCVYEMEEFDRAVQAAAAWCSNRTDTLLIVTADHETGGLAILQNNGQGNAPTVSWSTSGHTDADVGVFAQGPGAERVSGLLDNTDIYRTVMQSQAIVPKAVAMDIGPAGAIRMRWDAKPGDVCRLRARDSLFNMAESLIATVTAGTHVVVLSDTNAPASAVRYYYLTAGE